MELPKLKYEYNALEPHIDAKTMEIHHLKHHAGYTNKLNELLSGTDLEGKNIEDILSGEMDKAIRNHAGGFYNHSLFWEIMSPPSDFSGQGNGGGEPKGEFIEVINKDFGSFEKFKEEFANAGSTRFGSGWAWLVKTEDGLKISSTSNQDNPLMDDVEVKGTPILGLDVWEHAYYLNYQNRRAEYIEAFWNVVDWEEVSKRYKD